MLSLIFSIDVLKKMSTIDSSLLIRGRAGEFVPLNLGLEKGIRIDLCDGDTHTDGGIEERQIGGNNIRLPSLL
jgi:hypothetical protein